MAMDHAGQGEPESQGAAGGTRSIRAPGCRSPRARARSTMCRPGRSLMPPGLKPSSFAQKPRSGGVSGWDTRNSGVLPTSADRADRSGAAAVFVSDCMSFALAR
ncbi:hypothetical protein SALBM311S_12706 [Streptomyces alboniger]